MEKTKFILLGVALATVFLFYTVMSFDQQQKEQFEQLQSVLLTVEKQAAKITKLQTDLKLLQPSLSGNIEDNSDVDSEQVFDHNSKKMKNVNKKITLLETNQQSLFATVKQQAKDLQKISSSGRVEKEKSVTTEIQQSPEEIIAVRKAENEASKQRFDNFWQQQTFISDPWTQDIVVATKQLVSQANGINIREVNCTTGNICKIELTTTEEAEVSAEELFMMSEIESESVIQVKANADGSESIIIYMTGKGASLPAEFEN